MSRQILRRGRGVRRLPALALVAALLAAVTACGAVEPEPAAPSAPAAPSEIVVGVVGEFTSFNPATTHGDTPANRAVAEFTHESFAYLDDELAVVGNGGFGEVERLSADPLTVRYTLFEDRVWSDGTPVTLDDLLLGWAVHSGWFDDAAYDAGGDVVSGTRYFDVAAATDGIRQTSRPVLDRREQTLTLTYDEPFADWNREWLLDTPLHVVAARAGVSADDLVSALRTAPRGDPLAPVEPDPVLLAAAAAWNTGFDVTGATPTESAVTNGPFTPVSWNASEVILEQAAGYVGNHEPGVDRIVVRTYADDDTLFDAVAAGEVDVANLGETTAARIGRLEDAGVVVHTGARASVLALMFTEEGETIDTSVREALLATIDRDRLVEESVAAIDPDARPAQSFLATSALGDTFDEIVAASRPPATGADLTTARGLLDGRTPTLRLRYEPTDVLAADMFAEIARMAERAGIAVRPAGDDENADAELVTLDVETTLHRAARERTDGGEGGLAARDAVASLRERSDPEEVAALAGAVDAALFAHLEGVPLLERAGAVAVAADLEGVTDTAASSSAPRYFWTWSSTAPE